MIGSNVNFFTHRRSVSELTGRGPFANSSTATGFLVDAETERNEIPSIATAQVHYAARWRSGVADSRARGTAADAGDRIPQQHVAGTRSAAGHGLSAGARQAKVCRRPERGRRISLG